MDVFAQIKELKEQVESLAKREMGTGLIDYFASSTIVGWSSYTGSVLSYKRMGGLLCVFFYIEGTSNSTSTTATLPYAAALGVHNTIQVRDNSGAFAVGRAFITVAESTLRFNSDVAGSAWTASGTKRVLGEIVIPV